MLITLGMLPYLFIAAGIFGPIWGEFSFWHIIFFVVGVIWLYYRKKNK